MHSEPETLSDILRQLDAMDGLLAILRGQTRGGPILHITLASWAWRRLWQCNFDIHCVSFGDAAPDEEGRVRSLDGWYVYTQDGMMRVGVDPLQSIDYRLWDRKDWGWWLIVGDGFTLLQAGRQSRGESLA